MALSRIVLASTFLAGTALGFGTGAMAQMPAPAADNAPVSMAVGESENSLGTLESIEVNGNQRVEVATVETYIGLRKGEPVTENDLNEALKKLFATELFADASVRMVGSTVIVDVKENPVVNKIAFEGNEKYKDDELSKEIQLRPRGVYTLSKVNEDADRVSALYHRSGRFQAVVTPKIIQREQNRVDVVFEVNEGAVTKIQGINFVGNKIYSDRQLRNQLQSETTKWYKFLTSNDTYDQDRVNFDKEKLRRFYVSHGYADFKVNSVVTEFSPEDNGFYLTFNIEEGPYYTFGSINATSAFPDVSADDLKMVAATLEGEEYNANQIEETTEKMAEMLGDKGYAFAKVEPRLDRNPQTQTISVNYQALEAPRVYVDRINVTGNVRTMDKVIRREFRVSEGDPFSTSKIKRTEQRLKNLNYFEKINVNTTPGSAPDRANIEVDVSEKSTGELSLGAGFSTLDGALFDVGLREDNFLGAGKKLNARAMIAQQRQDYTFGYTEPYFLDREIAAGVDIFNTTQDFRTQSSFDRRTSGGRLRMGYALTEHLDHSVTYTLREDEVSNIRAGASRFIRDQEGQYATSMLGHSFLYDTRDSKFDPSKGFFTRFTQEVAGLGGDAQYLRHEARGGWFYSIVPQWIFQISGQAGHVLGLGDDNVRINDRFFVGMQQIRGFNDAGIGPRDLATGDALGGKSYYSGTVELGFPLPVDDDLGLRGAVFTDVASLWQSDENGLGVADENALRLSMGAGLAWASPFGPIRLDFGFPIIKEAYDDEQLVRFSFGTRF
jgi:outer membrane protein insertion porin family